MSRWRVRPTSLVQREHDYVAGFLCTHLDTGTTVTITLEQILKSPASDLVGACRALALLLERVSRGDDPGDEGSYSQVARMH